MLHVRRPGNDDVEEYKFLDDDPFLTEISEFVDVVEHVKPVENLLSTFEGTYEYAASLLQVIMIPTLHLPAIRCVQDVRTHVGDSQGRRRDACKTHIEVGFDWIAPPCSLIRVVMGSSHLVQIFIVQTLVQAVMPPWRSENKRERRRERRCTPV